MLAAGTVLMAGAINLAYDPAGIANGGFSGIAVILKSVTSKGGSGGIPIWVTNLVLNIPLFLIAWFVLGKRFIARTILGAIFFEIALYLIPVYPICGEDRLLAVIIGGTLEGAGMGLVFMANSTTGGTDMLSAIVHHFRPYYSMPKLLAVFDGIVVLTGAVVFGFQRAAYAMVSVYILSKVSDTILEGVKYAKMVYIISENYHEISEHILKDLNRGVTGIPARGMYTDAERNLLFCVVGKKELVRVKEIVKNLDPKSFVIVTDVREALGEGFLGYEE